MGTGETIYTINKFFKKFKIPIIESPKKEKVYCINCRYYNKNFLEITSCESEVEYDSPGTAIRPPEKRKVKRSPYLDNSNNDCEGYEKK